MDSWNERFSQWIMRNEGFIVGLYVWWVLFVIFMLLVGSLSA